MTTKQADFSGEDEQEDGEMRTIEVEVPISEYHAEMMKVLEDEGVQVNSQVATFLQERAEHAIHSLYQRARYSKE